MLEYWTIEGMHCPSCALGLEAALEEIEGIEIAQVDYETKQAMLTLEKEVAKTKVEEAIVALGFIGKKQ